MNHLDFKLAVGNISLWEYDQRMMENNEEAALSDAHFNESPTEGFNTDSNEDAPAEDINITELVGTPQRKDWQLNCSFVGGIRKQEQEASSQAQEEHNNPCRI